MCVCVCVCVLKFQAELVWDGGSKDFSRGLGPLRLYMKKIFGTKGPISLKFGSSNEDSGSLQSVQTIILG